VPVAEAAGAFRDLQLAGKIRHVGLSNYTAARLREWISVATAAGWPLPVALQPHYNLVQRQAYESELAPVVAEFGLGVLPYYGLAAGFLAGKYRSAADLEGAERARMAGTYLSAASLAVLDVVESVAAAHRVEPASVALAWLLTRPGVTAPLASARNVGQLGALLAAATIKLGDDEVAALDEASAKVAG
jgi:aryl-alcohol dehydrogenase-like predicted oxidoreductase